MCIYSARLKENVFPLNMRLQMELEHRRQQ
jgi:hypothetical protein